MKFLKTLSVTKNVMAWFFLFIGLKKNGFSTIKISERKWGKNCVMKNNQG